MIVPYLTIVSGTNEKAKLESSIEARTDNSHYFITNGSLVVHRAAAGAATGW